MRVLRLVSALAIAIAFVSTVFAPQPTGADVQFAPADGPVVLIDRYAMDVRPVLAAGADVLVDYGNGYVLARLPVGLAAELRSVRGVDFLPERTTIAVYYSGVTFDTAKGEPTLAPEWAAPSTGAYLLQFLGPIRSEWVAGLEARGLTFDQYLDAYAFVVRGSPAAIGAARASPYVSWVGPYRAGYKVGADLITRTGGVDAYVVGFGGVPVETLAAEVAALGAEPRVFDTNPATVVVTLPAERLLALAGLPGVISIQEYREPVVYDRIAGQIHKYHNAWDTRRSGLPSSLTGRSPGPDGIMYNADDTFEGGGLLDTGFDEGNANDGTLDFFDSPNGDRIIRFAKHSGPTLDGKCGSAHGTHVAGIVAGDGYSWERYLIENVGDTSVSVTDKEWHKSEAGVAPEAKLSIDGTQNGNDFSCGSGLGVNLAYWDCQYVNGYILVPTTSSSGTCLTPWTDASNVATHNAAIDGSTRSWVVVHSNSWGSGTGNYNPTAGSADGRMDAAADRIIVFAAGNDGPALNSISGEALLKNGLSIGASENFRPEQFDSDNANLMASFSSRGGPARSLGRIKPDLVAIGTSVVSLFARGETQSAGFTAGADLITFVDKYCSVPMAYCPSGDAIPDYRYLQGTSMAAPHAAGSALLVREYLREVAAQNNPASPYFDPPSYLVKALLVNGAVRMDPNLYEYPGYDQGWGRIDLEQSLFPPVPRTNQFAIGQFTTTGTWTAPLDLNVSAGDVPLKATLVWLTPGSDALGRDLNLRVVSPGGAEYHGNQYVNGWSDPTSPAYDTVNNVEQVEVQSPEAGRWQVEVRAVNVPTPAKFAVVFSADIGPQATYKVDLSTTFPTTVTVAPSGSAVIPLTVLNFGTVADTVQLSSNAPAGLTVAFYPTNAVPLQSGESQDVYANITASAAITPGVYEFDLRAVSGDDPSPTPASDFVPVRVEVLSRPLPYPLQVTNGSVDELDPSILTFTDATVGGSHIFIPYRKTSKVDPSGLTGGVNVWVAHATLDGSGQPVLPFTQTLVSNTNDNPNDLRLLRFHTGTLKNRVIVTWTGTDPSETNPDAASWSRIAFLDPGAGPNYYAGTWSVTTIQKNEGTGNPCNIARVSFPLFRAAGGGNGQVIYVWEILAYGGGCTGNPTAVVTSAKISTDGGASWGASTQIFPPPGNPNFYFFPNGVVDQNDVAWVFAYWRTPTGNDRDLTVRLYDGTWSNFPINAYTILDTTDNVQWPAAVSTNEGAAGNRVYVVFTRDNLQVDLKMYMAYTDQDYTSANPPRDVTNGGVNCGTGCTLSADFAPALGSGLKGPYGTSVSNANYNRRPILNIVQTTDGTVWLPHLENANPYRTPNLYTYYSNDGFATNLQTILTSDAFAKGHQMSSTLTVGPTPRVYETYHATRGTVTTANYEIYLLIYAANWQSAPDTLGPLADAVGGTPNPVNKSAVFRITANFNDITTGNSTIAAAEYSIDAPVPAGSGIAMVPVDGAFDSPTEAVRADVDAGALGWQNAECHPIFVRGQDAALNWGPLASYNECTDTGNVDRTPPTPPVLTAAALPPPAYADVLVRWLKAADENTTGGTTAYRVYRGTGLGGALAQVAEIPATNQSGYFYVDVGAGDGDPNVYVYVVKSVDAGGNEAQSVARAGKFTRTVQAGWQLLSVPVLPIDDTLGTAFQTFPWSRARTFVASDPADPWKAYIQVKGPQDFTAIDHTMAAWVLVTQFDTYTVAGLIPAGPTITLKAGWNFVGFPSWRATPYTVANLKAAVPQVTSVEAYDTLGPYYLRRLVDADALAQGSGYWIYVTTDTTWAVP